MLFTPQILILRNLFFCLPDLLQLEDQLYPVVGVEFVVKVFDVEFHGIDGDV